MSFDQAFEALVGTEGGFTDDPNDPGNWTPEGKLVGTKFGISGKSYPDLDIPNLTLTEAKEIYRRDFWATAWCDKLRPSLAYVVFDASVNNGPVRARKWLQTALGVTADGIWGPRTAAAYLACNPTRVGAEFGAQRLMFMTALPTWKDYGNGWSHRLSAVPYQAEEMT